MNTVIVNAGSVPEMTERTLGTTWRWWLACLAFAAGIAFSLVAADLPPPASMAEWPNVDKWFGADIFRIVKAETDPGHRAHFRNNVHPFYSAMTYPFVWAGGKLTGAEPIQVVMAFHGLLAGLLAVALYGLAALSVRVWWHAALLTALALSSAGFIFWSGVAETRVPAALTVAVVLAAHGALRAQHAGSWVLVNLLAFSMLITNWSVALMSMLLKLSWRRAFVLAAATLVVAVPLSLAQRMAFPESGLFFKGLHKEAGYVHLTRRAPTEVATKMVRRAVVWTTSGFLLPGVVHQAQVKGDLRPVFDLSLLEAKPKPLVLLGTLCWVSLLVLAVRAWWPDRKRGSVTTLAVMFLLGQFFLHLVYGNETFLFVLNSLPAFVVLIACAFRSSSAGLAAVLAGVATACGLLHNLPLLNLARLGMLG